MNGSEPPRPAVTGDATGGVIPYKNPAALIAYYCGIFSIIPCFGVLLGIPAVVLGIVGLVQRRKNPVIKGATFAIVAAGPDGFFGDEINDTNAPAGSPRRDAFDRMLIAAGFSASTSDPQEIVRARVKAEEDNIVEVGQ